MRVCRSAANCPTVGGPIVDPSPNGIVWGAQAITVAGAPPSYAWVMAKILDDPITDTLRSGQDGHWTLGNPTVTVTPPADTAPTPPPNPTFTQVGSPALVGLEPVPGT